MSFAQQKYFDETRPYEDKTLAFFKVFQVISDGSNFALAHESDNTSNSYTSKKSYYGKVVLLEGEDFYDEQEIKIKNPIHIGIYKYETKNGNLKTVPIISSEKYINSIKEAVEEEKIQLLKKFWESLLKDSTNTDISDSTKIKQSEGL